VSARNSLDLEQDPRCIVATRVLDAPRELVWTSWQVTPTVLSEMLQDQNAAKGQRVMKAMLQMRRLDIAALQRAQIA